VRTRAAVGGVLASAGILLVGWQVGVAATAGADGQAAAGPSAAPTTTDAPAETPTPSATPTPSPTPTPASNDGTYTGDSVGTKYGDVQVAVTIADNAITEVTAVRLTDRDGRSVQISNRAAPILEKEVLASQSADVANVSGATYTVRAYLSSLQSALDQAGM